jgi:hypothetical protein
MLKRWRSDYYPYEDPVAHGRVAYPRTWARTTLMRSCVNSRHLGQLIRVTMMPPSSHRSTEALRSDGRCEILDHRLGPNSLSRHYACSENIAIDDVVRCKLVTQDAAMTAKMPNQVSHQVLQDRNSRMQATSKYCEPISHSLTV